MKADQFFPFLKHPDSDAAVEFIIKDGQLVDKASGRQYPVISSMIDFQGSFRKDSQEVKKGLMFKLNTIFSKYIDFYILTSIFACGGVGFINVRNKVKQWINRFATDQTLFLEPEEKRLASYIGSENSLTVEDLASKNVMPALKDLPDINASHEQLPIRSSSFQNIISYFIIEHVKHPRQHIKEIERVLKPGGYAILGGPGDVYPSHRIPYNYFNIIRYGYHEMFKEFNLELVEEYFPAKSWMSILYLSNTTIVRNSYYNKNQYTKMFQLIIYAVSLVISPFLNLLALFLDKITPFDKRVYSLYMALLRKPDNDILKDNQNEDPE